MQTDTIREARLRQDRSKELAETGWYHSFELPDGTLIEGANPLGRLRERYTRFPIPADLRGKRLLDIGAWDGFFTFEAERHGAAVTSIDCVAVDHFVDLHRKMRSKADYRILEVYELAQAGLGTFEIVFFLGVLYHLRHPLLALEIVCSLTTDIAMVESFVTDGETWQAHTDDIPTLEFYEGYELANQFDNWVGPSVACLLAMCRAAGFARVELLRTEPYNALVACYRKWEPPPAEPAGGAPEMVSVVDSTDLGINLPTRKERYLQCWFRSSRAEISRHELKLEVDGLGVASHFCKRVEEGAWMANFALPRGLSPGWKEARLRFADSGFSRSVRIAVDLPLKVERIVCHGVSGPSAWKQGEVRAAEAVYLACWASGLPENADRNNVKVFLGEVRLAVHWLGEPDAAGYVQVNAALAPDFPAGEYAVRIECGGVTSAPFMVRVI